jgi:FlaA1/EpsC-like NDP-sugar epimerase
VRRFVQVSTDKAVDPSTVMGASKALAEFAVEAAQEKWPNTRYAIVRFGNVLGSSGSVVPIFRRQIALGGPVTVTDQRMTRYFMTIPEATQLVLQAGAMGNGGEIFILDMGDPIRIVDLARDMIALSGLKPDEDIQIKFSGVRAGEKLFEELSTDAEDADKTKHPKVFIGRIKAHDHDVVVAALGSLLAAAGSDDAEQVRVALGELVPEYATGRNTRSSSAHKSLALPAN